MNKAKAWRLEKERRELEKIAIDYPKEVRKKYFWVYIVLSVLLVIATIVSANSSLALAFCFAIFLNRSATKAVLLNKSMKLSDG